MSLKKTIQFLAYASGVAGAHAGSKEGPLVLQQSAYFNQLKNELDFEWQATLQPEQNASPSKLTTVAALCTELAKQTQQCTQQNKLFAVFGGDHTSGIGTWSGVAHAKRAEGPIGLIWIDAHMDSHTPETSQTGNLHGMPVASLLGHGVAALTQILDREPKIDPSRLCLIGIRSYESGEEDLLKRLNVNIFYMEEVKQRGLAAVVADAKKIVTRGTSGYGLSIDVDGLDPTDAPGTGVPEPDGIFAKDILPVLRQFADDPALIGFEIVEFDPSRDKAQKTEKIVTDLVKAIVLGKS